MKNGEYIGFLFSSYEDKEDFNGKMLVVADQLKLTSSLLDDFKASVVAK